MGSRLGKKTTMERLSTGGNGDNLGEVKKRVLDDIQNLAMEPLNLRKGGVAFFMPFAESGKDEGHHVERIKATYSQEFIKKAVNRGRKEPQSTVRKSVSFENYGEDEALLIDEIIQGSTSDTDDQRVSGQHAVKPTVSSGSSTGGYGDEEKLLMAEILRENLLQERGKLRGKTYEERLDRVRRRRQYKEEELRQKTAAKLKQDALKMMQHEHRQKAALDEKVKQNKLKILAVKQRCLQQMMAKQRPPDVIHDRDMF